MSDFKSKEALDAREKFLRIVASDLPRKEKIEAIKAMMKEARSGRVAGESRQGPSESISRIDSTPKSGPGKSKPLDEDVDYPHETKFQFDVLMGETSFTAEEFDMIEREASRWSEVTGTPCELTKNDGGFEARLRHFCIEGQGFGSDLFVTLARKAFRHISKSVSYRHVTGGRERRRQKGLDDLRKL